MAFEHLEDAEADQRHEDRIKRCNRPGCNAQIIWFKTESGKNVAVEADTVEASDEEWDWQRHVVHFGVCKGKR